MSALAIHMSHIRRVTQFQFLLLEDKVNIRERLSKDGHHGNRLECIVYFSMNTYICPCNISLTNRGKLCFRVLGCYHGNKA